MHTCDVCVCIHMTCVCMHTCDVCVCVCVCVCACLHVTCVCVCLCVCVCMHTCDVCVCCRVGVHLDFLSLVHIHVLVYLVTFLQVSWCTVLWLPSPCWHCYSWSCPPKNLNYIHDCFYTLLGSHIRAGAKRIDQLLASCAALCLYLVLCHTVL